MTEQMTQGQAAAAQAFQMGDNHEEPAQTATPATVDHIFPHRRDIAEACGSKIIYVTDARTKGPRSAAAFAKAVKTARQNPDATVVVEVKDPFAKRFLEAVYGERIRMKRTFNREIGMWQSKSVAEPNVIVLGGAYAQSQPTPDVHNIAKSAMARVVFDPTKIVDTRVINEKAFSVADKIKQTGSGIRFIIL